EGGTLSAPTAPAKRAEPRSTAVIDPKMTVCRRCIRFRRAARARAACCAGESFTGGGLSRGRKKLQHIVPDEWGNYLNFTVLIRERGGHSAARARRGARGAAHVRGRARPRRRRRERIDPRKRSNLQRGGCADPGSSA